MLMALLEVTGKDPVEIAEVVGYSPNNVRHIRRTNPHYVAYVKELREQLTSEVIAKTADLATRFDLEAPEAFETIKDLHKHSEMDTVRLGAAKDILDRAPNAPKIKQHIEGRDSHIILQLGVAQVEGIKEALADVGEREGIELLEGEGYEQVSDSPKRVEVREV